MNRNQEKELVKLSKELELAVKVENSVLVNKLYTKISDFIKDDLSLYKGWFNYLILNYEDFIDEEADLEQVFKQAILKSQSVQNYFQGKELAELLFLQYQLIDILTEYDGVFFSEYPVDYQLQLLNQTIGLNPNHSEAREKRAYIFQAIGDQDKMMKDFEAIEHSVENKNADFKRFSMANAYQLSQNDEKAIAAYEKILSHTTENTVKKLCYENLIQLYKKLENDEKEEYYTELLEKLN